MILEVKKQKNVLNMSSFRPLFNLVEWTENKNFDVFWLSSYHFDTLFCKTGPLPAHRTNDIFLILTE